jgi:hypothetical protein
MFWRKYQGGNGSKKRAHVRCVERLRVTAAIYRVKC